MSCNFNLLLSELQTAVMPLQNFYVAFLGKNGDM